MSGANLLNPSRHEPLPPAGVAIAQIQKAVNRNTGTSISTTFAGSPVQWNLIVCCLVLDKLETTYTIPSGFIEAKSEIQSNTASAVIFYKIAAAGEPTTITVTGLVGNSPCVLSIIEYEGIINEGLLDKTASFPDTTDGNTVTTGTTAATTQAKELAIAVVGTEKNNTSTSWSNSFLEQHADNAAGGPSLAVAHKILAATGAQETTWTFAGTASKGTGVIATFKGN